MGYILKDTTPTINLKLTDKGRRMLSNGKLTYTTYLLGDSEMDYTSNEKPNVNILKPFDNQHNIVYPLYKTNAVVKSPLDSIVSKPTIISETAQERGFFTYITGETNNWFVNTDLTSVSDLACEFELLTGDTMSYVSTTSATFNNDLTDRIKVGDYVLASFFPLSAVDGTYDDASYNPNAIDIKPIIISLFKIEELGNVDTETTGLTEIEFDYMPEVLSIKVDRKLTNTTRCNTFVYLHIIPNHLISEILDNGDPQQYFSSCLLGSSYTGTTSNIDAWNFNVIYRQNILGLDGVLLKDRKDSLSNDYFGTYIAYKYFEQTNINKIGVIHYTNHSVLNTYGEGFFQNTLTIDIPYIMWHKKQFTGISTGDKLGYQFVCGDTIKLIDDKIRYYDLVDQEETPTVVGKVFIDGKIIIIEHPELLTVLSLKAGRNYTLPKPELSLVTAGYCAGNSKIGSLEPNKKMCVTYYLIGDDYYQDSFHCDDYTTITNDTTSNKDVLFEFTTLSGNTDFSYLVDANDPTGYGFSYSRIGLLWQIVNADQLPDPTQWYKFDVTRYLATDGCLNNEIEICDQISFKTDFAVGFTAETLELSELALDNVLVFWNTGGTSSIALVPIEDYSITTNEFGTKSIVNFNIDITGGTIVCYYAYGTSLSSGTILTNYLMPSADDINETVPGLYIYNDHTNYNDSLNGVYAFGDPAYVYLKIPSRPSNNVVYLFYNGTLLNQSQYEIYGFDTDERTIKLLFQPNFDDVFNVYYIDNTLNGANGVSSITNPRNLENLKVVMDKSFTNISDNEYYDIPARYSLPAYNNTGFTFGDEELFIGNINTKIKATIYKTSFVINILPNTYLTSNNPTFGNGDKVSFTELGIYDDQDNLVCIGKFSEPISRKYNADLLTIEATIDF